MEFLFLHLKVTENVSSKISTSNKEAGIYGSCKKDTQMPLSFMWLLRTCNSILYPCKENVVVKLYHVGIDTLIFTRVVLNRWKHSALVSLAFFHFRDDV